MFDETQPGDLEETQSDPDPDAEDQGDDDSNEPESA